MAASALEKIEKIEEYLARIEERLVGKEKECEELQRELALAVARVEELEIEKGLRNAR